jgi:hypothetical protein
LKRGKPRSGNFFVLNSKFLKYENFKICKQKIIFFRIISNQNQKKIEMNEKLFFFQK